MAGGDGPAVGDEDDRHSGQHVTQDTKDEGEWTLIDHLCHGETALMQCDGRWRFSVTAPPAAAAAGCRFVCLRRDPPSAAGASAPGSSALDLLIEASRLQPQCVPLNSPRALGFL